MAEQFTQIEAYNGTLRCVGQYYRHGFLVEAVFKFVQETCEDLLLPELRAFGLKVPELYEVHYDVIGPNGQYYAKLLIEESLPAIPNPLVNGRWLLTAEERVAIAQEMAVVMDHVHHLGYAVNGIDDCFVRTNDGIYVVGFERSQPLTPEGLAGDNFTVLSVLGPGFQFPPAWETQSTGSLVA